MVIVRSNRMKENRIDIFLFIFAIFVYFTTNWKQITTLQWMVLILYGLCVIIRIANIMKHKK